MLKSITTRDFGREQCVSMHVWHQARGCVPTHSTPACQKQRATGSAQDPIHPGHKVTHFPEQEKIQLPVITAIQHYSLKEEDGGTHTQVRRCTTDTQTNTIKWKQHKDKESIWMRSATTVHKYIGMYVYLIQQAWLHKVPQTTVSHCYLLYNLFKVSRIQTSQLFTMRT